MIARSADFYGPDAQNAVPNLLVFEPLGKKRKASWLVNDAVPHSFTYTRDAQGLVQLAERNTAWNQTWHVPTTPNPLTGKASHRAIFDNLNICRVPNRHLVRTECQVRAGAAWKKRPRLDVSTSGQRDRGRMGRLSGIMDRQVATTLRAPTCRLEPPCPSCHSHGPKPTVRTLYVVYYRCDACGEIWCLDKPVLVPVRL